MCEICFSAEDKFEVIPGLYLIKFVKDSDHYKAGTWGLIRNGTNDPIAVWDFEPKKDPLKGMSEEDLEKLSEDEFHNFLSWKEDVENVISVSPEIGYWLVGVAMEVGYQYETSFAEWVFNRMADMLEAK